MIEIEVQNETHQTQHLLRFAAVPRIGEGLRLREPDGCWASYDVLDVWYQKAEFGDVQIHAEWLAPADYEGPWYGAGNNGVTLMDQFEIQIFDSYQNRIRLYADGQCAAIYGQTPPRVNACRKAERRQRTCSAFRRRSHPVKFFGPPGRAAI